MGEAPVSTNGARPEQSEEALPWLFERGMVLRLQVPATLVLVVLIGCLVSETFRESLDPMPFPLFAAVGYPYVLLTGLVVFQREMLLHRLRQATECRAPA